MTRVLQTLNQDRSLGEASYLCLFVARVCFSDAISEYLFESVS